MNPTDGLPDGWEVVKEAPTAAEVIAHLDAHGVTDERGSVGPFVQDRHTRSGWVSAAVERRDWIDALTDGGISHPFFRLIAPVVRSQVDPAVLSIAAQESQGATGAGGSATPGPIEHADPLPACPLCGAQPGGCEHVEVSRDHDEVTGLVTPGVVIRRTVVIITYPWEDA